MNQAINVPRVPNYVPYLGHGLAFGKDADKLIGDCWKKYGDVFQIKIMGKWVTFFVNPRDYPAFAKQSKYLNSEEFGIDVSASAFGLDKDYLYQHMNSDHIHDISHMSQRFMAGGELGPLTERMQDKVEEILIKLPTNKQPGDLFDFCLELIFMAGTDALLGDGLASEQLMEDFRIVDKYFPLRVGKVPAFFLPGFGKALQGFIKPLGQQRNNQSRFMDERYQYLQKELPGYNDKDELAKAEAGLLWAAQANTAVVAFFTLFFILRNPELKQAIEEEVREALAASTKKSPQGFPYLTSDVMDKMEKLDSCISETLRLISSPLSMRKVTQGIEIPLANGGFVKLKQGEATALYPRITHINPEIYPDPYTFKWDRFMGKQKPNSFSFQGEPLKYSLLPFGVGLSMCPGRHFARNEFKVITALIFNWCNIDLTDTEMPELDKTRVGLGSLTPKSSIGYELARNAA